MAAAARPSVLGMPAEKGFEISVKGIAGAPLGTLLCYVTACGINLAFCVKKAGYTPEPPLFLLKALLCGLFCAGSASFAQRISEPLGSVSALCAVAVGGLVYLLALLVTGILQFGDIKSILAKFLRGKGKQKLKT